MKPSTIIAGTLSLFIAGGAAAEGFEGSPATTVSSVAEALQLEDDAVALLEGHIVEMRSAEHYEFRDASGAVEVEIDADDWRGVDVTPDQTVRIWVEVDRDRGDAELEVERIELVTK